MPIFCTQYILFQIFKNIILKKDTTLYHTVKEVKKYTK